MREIETRVLHPSDLLSLMYVHDARLSADGRRLAILTSRSSAESDDECFELAVVDLTTESRVEIKYPGKAIFPRWSPDGNYLAFVGTQNDASRLFVAGKDGLAYVPVTPAEVDVQGPPSWDPTGSTIAYTAVVSERQEGVRRIKTRVFRSEGAGIVEKTKQEVQIVDVGSLAIRSIDVGHPCATQPLFSPCGNYLLFLGTDTAVGQPSISISDASLYTVDLNNGDVVEVLDDTWHIDAFAWAPCGKRVIVAGDYGSSLTLPVSGIWVVNRDGTHPECRTRGYVGHIGTSVHHDMPTWNTHRTYLCTDPVAEVVYASAETHGHTEIWRVSLEGPLSCVPVVTGARTCLLLDMCAATQQLLYCATDLTAPWELYRSDIGRAEERRLTHLNDTVLSKWPGFKVRYLTFKSGDGLPLEAWALIRADREGPQPTVMFVHGGPFLSTGNAFRYDFLLLAANGFTVIFANYRGSAGYGPSFVRGIMGDFGARGFPDHIATIEAAVTHGLADPERLGVWGPSHGGFATTWIVTHDHRFRAAVAESAWTDFSTLYYLSDMPDWIVSDLGGRPHEIPDVYRSRSPMTYAAACRTPTLMLHGEDDLRCPIAEAEQFYRVLCDVGCTAELVRIPKMIHFGDSIGPLSVRLEQNEALLEWFERHL